MKRDELYVRLRLCSETQTPHSITEKVGLRPDTEWRIGDKRAKTIIVERTHGWIVDSQCARHADFESQLSALMNRIMPFAEQIYSLRDECSIELSCVLYSYAVNPELWIESATMQSLAAIGARLAIDIYPLSDTEGCQSAPALDLKPGVGYDLYKDPKGNILVEPKGGGGPGTEQLHLIRPKLEDCLVAARGFLATLKHIGHEGRRILDAIALGPGYPTGLNIHNFPKTSGNKKERDELHVRLRLCSETQTPHSITEKVGLRPDTEWRIGDKRAKTIIVQRTHGWIVDSQCARHADFQSHLSTLMNRIMPFAEQIYSLRDECSIDLSCVLYNYVGNPELWIESATMQSLAAIGAQLSIDIYLLSVG